MITLASSRVPRKRQRGVRRWTVPALVLAAAQPALAQTEASAYPNRVVTLIVPFSPGASTDIVARLIAQKLTAAWGQTVVVENRPGASGAIGLSAIARSAADGHTLGMMIVSHATNAALLGNKAPIDLVKDFAHIGQVVSQPYLLVINPSLPVRSVPELIALAKSRPGAVTYGSSGVGSVLHLAGELLAAQTRIRITHVPYKGAAPALSDVAGGHIAMLFTSRMSAQPLLAAGKVRALAVTSTERAAGAPEIPTLQEAAKLASYEVNGWYGVCAAAGTPPALVERLNRDINRVLGMPEVRERMTAAGTLPAGGTPAQFAQLVRSEVEKWSRIIRQAGLSTGSS